MDSPDKDDTSARKGRCDFIFQVPDKDDTARRNMDEDKLKHAAEYQIKRSLRAYLEDWLKESEPPEQGSTPVDDGTMCLFIDNFHQLIREGMEDTTFWAVEEKHKRQFCTGCKKKRYPAKPYLGYFMECGGPEGPDECPGGGAHMSCDGYDYRWDRIPRAPQMCTMCEEATKIAKAGPSSSSGVQPPTKRTKLTTKKNY